MVSPFSDLPNDLIIKILSLLPVESILKFKTVSKSWNQLLSSPFFATIHSLSSSPLSQPFPLFFSTIRDDSRIYYIRNTSTLSLQWLNFRGAGHLNCIACDNGIICFHCSFCSTELLFVGNPVTSKYRCLPGLGGLGEEFLVGNIGISFDPITQNFKILVRGRPKSEKAGAMPFEWRLFSSVNESWKTIQDPGYNLENVNSMVCVGNTCYVLSWTKLSLLAFDLERETVEELPNPVLISPKSSDRELSYRFSVPQKWGERVAMGEITGDLKLKMWVLCREREWVEVIVGNLQNFGLGIDDSLSPLLLVGETFFLHNANKNMMYAYNIKSGRLIMLQDNVSGQVDNLVLYQPTLFSCFL
ncbi:hypothetical protein AMTRI_Chr07g75440 [Amborella trichopoda]|uniref:F-box domain-containing protein n=1 Tax=Amborella trichopoda TaxID=13333 RepID=U5DBM7_AMBTC|nr:F-box protein At3g57590-like [Amborella trichopoda]ERN18837.1 hypothetical protein AMTR_s00067p00123530 [Amborella trichopoda]|eukprot:XP_020531082.1 F-box protein At3g57590-like [Amborella trichopoda]